jgi:hypothetical protein
MYHPTQRHMVRLLYMHMQANQAVKMKAWTVPQGFMQQQQLP